METTLRTMWSPALAHKGSLFRTGDHRGGATEETSPRPALVFHTKFILEDEGRLHINKNFPTGSGPDLLIGS